MKTQSISNNAKVYLAFMVSVAACTCFPMEAHAALGDLVKNMLKDVPAFTDGAVKFAALVGLVAIMMGIIGLMTRHKSQVPVGICVGMIIGGIALLGIVQLSTEGLASVFGSNTANSGLKQITGSSS